MSAKAEIAHCVLLITLSQEGSPKREPFRVSINVHHATWSFVADVPQYLHADDCGFINDVVAKVCAANRDMNS